MRNCALLILIGFILLGCEKEDSTPISKFYGYWHGWAQYDKNFNETGNGAKDIEISPENAFIWEHDKITRIEYNWEYIENWGVNKLTIFRFFNQQEELIYIHDTTSAFDYLGNHLAFVLRDYNDNYNLYTTCRPGECE